MEERQHPQENKRRELGKLQRMLSLLISLATVACITGMNCLVLMFNFRTSLPDNPGILNDGLPFVMSFNNDSTFLRWCLSIQRHMWSEVIMIYLIAAQDFCISFLQTAHYFLSIAHF